uniref:Transposase Tc1-like domain-containing protein n=1 Tax=Hucho hucho TaxID=62062 RepID=A0A4W5Q2P1_9TELE
IQRIPEHIPETRAIIIALHKKDFTGKDIAASKIAPKSTIYRIIKNFKEMRPRKSSKSQDRLLKLIQLDRGNTSTELAQEWQQAGVSASARTVRRRLLEGGLVSSRAAKNPLLSRKNIRDRLIFCKRYRDWTAEDWGKWLGEQNIDILGPWSGNSPDLKPIENLWSILKEAGGQTKTHKF